jgi:uncharacterized radical SAM superfamily Fe-S cluster-containing enzyme
LQPDGRLVPICVHNVIDDEIKCKTHNSIQTKIGSQPK